MFTAAVPLASPPPEIQSHRAGRVDGITDGAIRAERLDRIRWQREALLSAADDLAKQAVLIEQAGQ